MRNLSCFVMHTRDTVSHDTTTITILIFTALLVNGNVNKVLRSGAQCDVNLLFPSLLTASLCVISSSYSFFSTYINFHYELYSDGLFPRYIYIHIYIRVSRYSLFGEFGICCISRSCCIRPANITLLLN